MANKIELKSKKNKLSVTAYLNSIEPTSARKEAKLIAKTFKDVTGVKPKMWGASIVGYGEYTYSRSNGDVGEYMASGFSIRKSGPTIYIMPGYQDYSAILKDIGPHKLGKSCLYLKNLDGVDLKIISKLITRGIKDLKKSHTVTMK